MIRLWTWCAVVAVLLASPAAAGPQRIVSMNLCTDQLALLLVGPSRIASISWLGADPAESALADLAKGIPVNHGLAEEVIAAKPDLILTGQYTTGFAKAMLRRLDYHVVEIDSPTTIVGIGATLTAVGEAVGEPERTAALLAEMDRRLADAARAAAGRFPGTAIVYDANGFTVGRPGLADDVMTLLGLTNQAPALGIGAYGQVSLESMLAARPDHIIHLIYRPGVPSIASAAINHPALKKVLHGRKPLEISGRLLTCGTPLVADAAEQLLAALAAEQR
ncbi:MAG: ABC transporter substrate-binding protein [Rhodospirillaceae bacterium]|nr:ABC transporter substrate-binding protein [Rhodospirillaceae bacterium]